MTGHTGRKDQFDFLSVVGTVPVGSEIDSATIGSKLAVMGHNPNSTKVIISRSVDGVACIRKVSEDSSLSSWGRGHSVFLRSDAPDRDMCQQSCQIIETECPLFLLFLHEENRRLIHTYVQDDVVIRGTYE